MRTQETHTTKKLRGKKKMLYYINCRKRKRKEKKKNISQKNLYINNY